MPLESSRTGRLIFVRFRRWARNIGLARKLTAGLAVASLISGGATYLALTGTNPLGPNPNFVRFLLAADAVFLIALFAVVMRGLLKLWLERRSGAAGSRLHMKIIGLFAGVAAMPAIIMAVFSVLFFNLGLDTWFSKPISTAVNESVQVAESYIGEHRKTIQGDALSIAADLNRNAWELSRNPALLDSVVNTLARLRSLSEVMVFDSAGQILARSSFAFLMELEKVPPWAMERAKLGEVVLLTSEYEDRVRALVRLDNLVGVFLYVGRIVEPRVIEHLERTRQAAREYSQLQVARTGLEITFAVIFSVVALLVLLATVAFGLAIATRLVRPISGMIDAAERVRAGDFSARIPSGLQDDEMAALARAFNRMTMQLEEQRADLVEANRQLDERRRFTEAVLAGVSAGVIGLSPEGRIDLLNPSAMRLLGAGAGDLIGRSLDETVPEMTGLLGEARERPERIQQAQLTINRSGRIRNLAVVIGAEQTESAIQGFVVTFDDITDLVSAQRTAAWADVARRIAHEIKNPLTPIQLSAERLRRKYLKEITSDPEIFNKCTDTIIRQVGDIGRMVDEFSSFARMPAPVFKTENVSELVRQAVFLQQVARPEINYVTTMPKEPVRLRCDGRQLAQVFTNLLQNAADAIEGRRAEDAEAPPGKVEVAVRLHDAQVVVAVTDNGRGLPKENRERLTEPYVTTRSKGTGLGLAIVKKIMEEHGGGLMLGDSAEGGARIEIIFPNSHPDLADTARETDKARVSHGA